MLHHTLLYIYKPYIIGPVLFLIYIKKCKVYLGVLDTLLILMLIYQVGLLIEIIIYSFINYELDINLICTMADNNTGGNPAGSSTSGGSGSNNDLPRLIRYLTANVAALAAKRPMTRALGLTIANSGIVLADIASDERKANFWLEQANHFRANRTFKVIDGKSVNFENGANPFDDINNIGNTNGNNFLPDFNFFKDIFTPVEHSIPLETLQNVHLVMTVGLFIIVLCVVLLLVYFFINLLIIFNKDYLLNRVKNKYALLYIKYVLFRTKIETVTIGVFIIGTLCFVLYILHYLIVHPVIIKT